MLMDSSFFLTILTTVAAAILLRKFRNHKENEDVGSSSSSSPSSSSPPSSLSCKWTHHVFPSFRGEDVRRNFLSHIQKEFRRKGITPFNDNGIRRGESIGPELIKAIRRSKIAIVLISRNYASSKWCLDELVEIMKCKNDLGQTVFVIFYEVDPSHVKKLTGEFGAVFEKTCKGKTKEDTGKWRQAFADVATIAGYDSRNWENDADMIDEIVTEISKRLIDSTPSNDFKGLIGMASHMERMKELLCLGSDERRMIGIWGPSGIGKTTIARVVHNQISDGFQLSVFMTFKPNYARPTCSDDHDVKLQLEQQLLSQLMNQEDIQIHHLGTAQNLLMDTKVLIVLDGVNQSVQLRAMPKAQCLGPGTRIIVTTQDQKLLNAFEIKHIYKVDFPPPDEALQIFCMNAFGQDSPYDGFEKLAMKVTILAGNLPLGLRVMGSYFKGMPKEEWKAELPRLKIRLDGEIGSILKFSYDALDEEDKDLFLHIACFFNDEDIDEDIYEDIGDIINDTVDEYKFSDVQQGVRILRQRSLISNERFYPMHRLLVQLGREIVRNQSIHEPGKRQFLVDARDICEVLTDNTGSKSVIGINFDFSMMIEDELNISERAFEDMSNLQLLRFSGAKLSISPVQTHKSFHYLPQGLSYLPPNLKILHWDHCPMTCFPSKFNTKSLVKIIMKHSKLEILWEGIQPLRNLKQLNLKYSTNLKELPDLSTATNLQKLELDECLRLVELPSSIGDATNLKNLRIQGRLRSLPYSIGNLSSLQHLVLLNCSNLVELPSSIGNMFSLWLLYLVGCSKLVELPPSIGNLIKLHTLNLYGCSSLVELPSSIGNLIHLEELDLNCSRLMELPSSIGNLIKLHTLNLNGCSNLVELPSSIGNLIKLDTLKLSGCSNLVELPSYIGNLIGLWKLDLEGCSSLVELPSSIRNLIHLQYLNLNGCSKLVELPPSIGNLINLQTLNLKGCSNLVELPSSIGNLINLQTLNLSGCSKLVELPSSIGNLIGLRELYLDGCSSLVELPSSIGNLIKLNTLILIGCSNLVELPSSIGNFIHLKELDLYGCSRLMELPSSIGNLIKLHTLNLNGCSNLVELPSSIGNLIKLDTLKLSGCSNLVELPSSIGNLIGLWKLDLDGCSSLVELPSSIGNLCSLSKLSLQGCSKLEVVPINNLVSLGELDVTGCPQLISLSEISTNIRLLTFGGTLMKEVSQSIICSQLRVLRITYYKSLEELPHALDIITDLELNNTEIEEVPPYISGITRLRRLILNKCTKLVSLSQLPSSLSCLHAENCESLERFACSFPHPEICLKFINCWKLNEKSRDIIFHTPTNEYLILPGREVPVFFTYRAATGGCLRVKLNQRHFHTSLRFKACMLLVNKGDTVADYKEKKTRLYFRIMDKPRGRNTIVPLSKDLLLHPLLAEHMYIFEAEANNVESGELFFEFGLYSKNWEIGECGICPLLEGDRCLKML